MRLEFFLLFILLGGFFCMFVLIPVALIFGVWNYGLVGLLPEVPQINILVAFLIYAVTVFFYSFKN